jgi:prepilin-type N-terminal cleavage/methylation domain-containing protein
MILLSASDKIQVSKKGFRPDVSLSSAFTLIELLVVISIIAVLASLALPAVTGALIKGQINQTTSNYRQLYILTQSASLDNVSGGGVGAFPGDLSNSITAWSNALVPAYCSSNTFSSLGAVKGRGSNTLVWFVKSADEPNTIFLSTAGIAGTSNNMNLAATGPYQNKGGAFVTVGGSAITITGTNSPTLTNGTGLISTNASTPFGN